MATQQSSSYIRWNPSGWLHIHLFHILWEEVIEIWNIIFSTCTILLCLSVIGDKKHPFVSVLKTRRCQTSPLGAAVIQGLTIIDLGQYRISTWNRYPASQCPSPLRRLLSGWWNQESRWDGGFTQGVSSPSSRVVLRVSVSSWNETQRRVWATLCIPGRNRL